MKDRGNNNFMDVLTKGVQKQVSGEGMDEIVDKFDDFEESTIVVDSEILDGGYPEYIVDTSLNEEKSEHIIVEKENEDEVEFLDVEEDLNYDINPFSEEDMSISNPINGFDILEIEEISDEFKMEVDFDLEGNSDIDFIDDSDDSDDLDGLDDSDGFDELSWGEEEGSDLDLDLDTDEEILEEDIYNEEFEESVQSEEKEKNLKNSVIDVQEEQSKGIEIEETEELEIEDDKYKDCIFYKGMTIEDYLRDNPKYREKEYVEHFFNMVDINEALDMGSILLKKGKFRI